MAARIRSNTGSASGIPRAVVGHRQMRRQWLVLEDDLQASAESVLRAGEFDS